MAANVDLYKCPITQVLMINPVIATDGITYEEKAIQTWLESHTTSPMTNLPLESKKLIPNITLRNVISSWMKGHEVNITPRFIDGKACCRPIAVSSSTRIRDVIDALERNSIVVKGLMNCDNNKLLDMDSDVPLFELDGFDITDEDLKVNLSQVVIAYGTREILGPVDCMKRDYKDYEDCIVMGTDGFGNVTMLNKSQEFDLEVITSHSKKRFTVNVKLNDKLKALVNELYDHRLCLPGVLPFRNHVLEGVDTSDLDKTLGESNILPGSTIRVLVNHEVLGNKINVTVNIGGRSTHDLELSLHDTIDHVKDVIKSMMMGLARVEFEVRIDQDQSLIYARDMTRTDKHTLMYVRNFDIKNGSVLNVNIRGL